MGRPFMLISFALRDASKSRVILILIILSLSVAFAAVLATASILEGFQKMLEDGAIAWLGHIVITPGGDDLSISDIDEVKRILETVDNVSALSLRSYATVGVRYKGKLINPYIAMGVNEIEEQETSSLPHRLLDGIFVHASRPKEVVIGRTLADALVGLTYDQDRIPVREEIEVVSLTGMRGHYTIAGILDAKTFHPNWTLYFPKEELERLDSTRRNSEIIVKLKDPSLLSETKRAIKDKGLDVEVATWREESGYIDDIMQAVSFITGLINGLLIVSVFVVISVIIFINVFQKRRQIGIMKSMGASARFIVVIYIVETMVYAVLSYALGFFLFLFIHQYSFQRPIALLIGDFTTVFDLERVLFSFAALLVAALAGSIVPALIASRTRIVDVIRGTI